MGTTTPRWGFYKPDSMEDGWADEGHAWIDALEARARTSLDHLFLTRYNSGTTNALKDSNDVDITFTSGQYRAIPWNPRPSDENSELSDPQGWRNQTVQTPDGNNAWLTETAGQEYVTFTLPPGVYVASSSVAIDRMPSDTGSYAYTYFDWVDFTTVRGYPDDFYGYFEGAAGVLFSARPSFARYAYNMQLITPTVTTEFVLGMTVASFTGAPLKVMNSYLAIVRIH